MEIVLLILRIVTWVIIADAILSWIQPDPRSMPRRLTVQLTDPIYRPIRKVLDPSKTGGLDLSPLVVIAVLYVIRVLILRFAA